MAGGNHAACAGGMASLGKNFALATIRCNRGSCDRGLMTTSKIPCLPPLTVFFLSAVEWIVVATAT